MPECAQLLERLEALQRTSIASFGNSAQELGAIGIDADVPVAGKSLSGSVLREAAKASRAQGTGARLK